MTDAISRSALLGMIDTLIEIANRNENDDAQYAMLVAAAYIKDAPALDVAPVRTNLNTLRDAVYLDALEHGLWRQDDTLLDGAQMILHESAELIAEGYDYGAPSRAYCMELADVIIMALSAAGHFGIDIDAAVREKMAINKRRPYRHGKEKNT